MTTMLGDPAPTTRQHPHELAIDLGETVTVHGFLYLPRSSGNNGTIRDHEWRTSEDGVTWTTAAKGAFALSPGDDGAHVARLQQPIAGVRAVMLVATSEVQGRPWASCAELSVLVGPATR